MKKIFKDWRTSLGGVSSAVVGGLVYTGKVPTEQGTALLGVIGFIIGLFSKDSHNARGIMEDNTDPVRGYPSTRN
jgi:hypothetical protein